MSVASASPRGVERAPVDVMPVVDQERNAPVKCYEMKILECSFPPSWRHATLARPVCVASPTATRFSTYPMLRSALAACARRRQFTNIASSSTPQAPTRIGHVLAAREKDAADAVAVVVHGGASASSASSGATRWTYGEVWDRARWFAAGLSEMGYAPGQRLGVRLDNGAELLVALLGASLTGAEVETAKTAEALAGVKCRGTLVHHSLAAAAGKMVGAHEPIAVGGGAISDPIVHWDIMLEAFKGKEAPLPPLKGSDYFFSTTRATSEASMVESGAAAAMALGLKQNEDRLCVSVPLAHSMGLGFGVLAAFQAGATVVLPSPGAEGTLAAMADEKCTLMLADSHTLNALPQGLSAPPAGLESFRGGLTKIGSGDAIGLDNPRMWAGVPFTTVGKPAAPA